MPNARLVDLAATLKLSVSSVSKALRGDPGVSARTRARVLKQAKRVGFIPDAFAQSLKQTARDTSRITLDDVARAAHCSKMAVSLALRDQPGIAPKTAAQIRKMARKLGYIPNAGGALLAARRHIYRKPVFHSVIGVVIGQRHFNPILHPTPPDKLMYEQIRKHAAELGMSVDFFWLHDPAHGKRLPEILRARSIQGLILQALDDWDFHYFQPHWEHFSTVQLSVHPEEARFHYTFTNLYSAIWQLATWTCQLGFRKPAMVLRRGANRKYSMCLSAAIREACQPFHIKLGIYEWDYDHPTPEPVLAYLDKYKPDLVFTWQDLLAQWLQRFGRKVPECFNLVDLQVNPYDSRDAGLLWSFNDIAATAVDMVYAQLGRNERGIPAQPHGIYLPIDWRHGSSLRLPPGAPASPFPGRPSMT